MAAESEAARRYFYQQLPKVVSLAPRCLGGESAATERFLRSSFSPAELGRALPVQTPSPSVPWLLGPRVMGVVVLNGTGFLVSPGRTAAGREGPKPQPPPPPAGPSCLAPGPKWACLVELQFAGLGGGSPKALEFGFGEKK